MTGSFSGLVKSKLGASLDKEAFWAIAPFKSKKKSESGMYAVERGNMLLGSAAGAATGALGGGTLGGLIGLAAMPIAGPIAPVAGAIAGGTIGGIGGAMTGEWRSLRKTEKQHGQKRLTSGPEYLGRQAGEWTGNILVPIPVVGSLVGDYAARQLLKKRKQKGKLKKSAAVVGEVVLPRDPSTLLDRMEEAEQRAADLEDWDDFEDSD